MLAEAEQCLIIDLKRSSDLYYADPEVEQEFCCQPRSLWDEVAMRWPDGGRFPSFISFDQSA